LFVLRSIFWKISVDRIYEIPQRPKYLIQFKNTQKAYFSRTDYSFCIRFLADVRHLSYYRPHTFCRLAYNMIVRQQRGFFPTCRDFYVPRPLRRPTTKHLVILLAIFIDLLPPKLAAPELRRSPKSKHVHVPKELTIMNMPSAPTLVQQRPRESWGKERHLWSTLFR